MRIDYVGENSLKRFLKNIQNIFAIIDHEHTKDEIVDLPDIDAELAQKSQIQIVTWEADD